MIEHQQPSIEAKFSSHGGSIETVSFSPNQRYLCFAGNATKVIITNLESKKTEHVLNDHSDFVFESSFSHDSSLVATCSADCTIRVWNLENNTLAHTILEKGFGELGSVRCVQFFHKDSTRVISGGYDKMVRVWDIERKKSIFTLDDFQDSPVHSVDLLPDNNTLISGDEGGYVRVFDLRTEESVKALKCHKRKVNSVCFHPDGTSFATGSYDGSVQVHDFRKFVLCNNSIFSHGDYVYCVDFHPSGKFLVSGSADQTIKIFDLEEDQTLFTLGDHQEWVRSVRFSPDGKYFASGSYNNRKHEDRIFLWKFPLDFYFRTSSKRQQSEKDEQERLEKLVSDKELYPTFPIQLSNKTLNLWKSTLLISSKIDVDSLSKLSLSLVDEEVLFQFMVGNAGEVVEKIQKEQLGDHFIFSHKLGMKYETKAVVDSILKIQDLGECYKLFSSFCQKYENSEIRGWFSPEDFLQNVEFLDETTFDTSFALQLFIRIIQLKKQYYRVDNDTLFLNLYLSRVLFQSNRVKKELSILEHPDFKGSDPKDFDLCTKMKKLRNGVNTNLTVITVDQKQFRVHREILSYKTNFFSKMFHFHGRERESILQNGTVQLESLNSESFEILLDLIYFGKIEEENKNKRSKSLEILVPLLVHFHMYQEQFMFNQLLSYLRTIPNPGNLKEVLEKEGVGSLLFENAELMHSIIRVLSDIDPSLKKKDIESFVLNSYRNSMEKQLNDVKENLKQVEEQSKEKLRMKDEKIEELEEEIRELRMKVNPVLGGRKRKRGNDDEKVEKKKPKKKRKM